MQPDFSCFADALMCYNCKKEKSGWTQKHILEGKLMESKYFYQQSRLTGGWMDEAGGSKWNREQDTEKMSQNRTKGTKGWHKQ